MKGARLTACLVFLTALLEAGCGKKEQHKPAGPAMVTGVKVETVKAAVVDDYIEASGTVRARNSAQLFARIPGTVTALHAREGDQVGKGKLLITLEAVETTAGATAAQAAIGEAQQAVAEAESRKKLMEATSSRYRKLFDEQAVTRQEFEEREMEREVAGQGLARARARLLQAREQARAAGASAGYARITAPIAGIITTRGVEVGMTAFPGTALMTVEETGSYRLEAAAPESLLGRVKQGDAVMVSVGDTAPQSAKVIEVVPSVDPASRTFLVKIQLQAKGLRSGMYGRAFFTSGTREGILVPKSALFERGALTSVWVVGEDRVGRMRLVKTGRTIGDRIEVLSGLSPGDRLVVDGGEKIVDGARIEQAGS